MNKTLKIWHLSYSDQGGGAARAAFRIFQTLEKHYSNSSFVVHDNQTNKKNIINIANFGFYKRQKISSFFSNRVNRFIGKKYDNISLSIIPSNISKLIKLHKVDIVHLHWVCNEMISIDDIGKVNVPIVWTLHDMWPFSGIKHYSSTNNHKKNHYLINMLDQFILNKKKNKFTKKIIFIGPSKWITKCAKDSTVTNNFDVKNIPYPINHDKWFKEDSLDAKNYFNFKNKEKFVLFGAAGGTSDPRKGFDILIDALFKIKDELNFNVVVFGGDKIEKKFKKINIINIGEINSDRLLRKLYSACDIFALTSRMDNLPLTGMEAMACGLPMIGFKTTGINDLISHKKTGWLANPFSVDELAFGAKHLLTNDKLLKEMSKNSIQKSISDFDEIKILNAYKSIYDNLVI